MAGIVLATRPSIWASVWTRTFSAAANSRQYFSKHGISGSEPRLSAQLAAAWSWDSFHAES